MNKPTSSGDIETLHKLTETQLGILYQCLLSSDQSTYQNQIRLNIAGEFEPTLFEQSINKVIARHESLRSVYLHDGLDQPATVVKRNASLPSEQLDLSHLSEPEQNAEIIRIATTKLNTKIALNKAPLLRLTSIRLAHHQFHLILDFHHIIFDGWSNTILFSETKAFYAAGLQGSTPKLPIPSKFSDFIATQSNSPESRGQSFWKNKLSGITEPTPLPLDKQGIQHSVANAQYEYHLNNTETTTLRNVARHHRITLNALIASAWGYTLSRYANSDDIMFGVAVNGRSNVIDAHEHTIGLFVNTLPLRLQCHSSNTITQWLQHVQKELVDINRYEQTPLSSIHKVSELKPGIELFESLLVFQSFSTDTNAEQLDKALPWKFIDTTVHENSPLPLTLEVFDTDCIAFLAMFNDTRLDRLSVEQLIGHLCTTLRSMAEHSEPIHCLTDISMLSEQQADNETKPFQRPPQIGKNVPNLFELFQRQVAHAPDSLAVTDNKQSLTFKQLADRVASLELYLRQRKIESGDRVLISTARNVDMYPAILALIKINALFVPIDTSWPQRRIELIIEDCQAKILLADEDCMPSLSDISIPIALIDGSTEFPINAQEIKTQPGDSKQANANHLYIMYTSGSSGTPKGVVGTHSSTLNRFTWMWGQYPFMEQDTCVQKAPLCFVDSIWELFGGLLKGVTTHIVSDEQIRLPVQFVETLEQHRATHLVIVPSLLSILLKDVENIGTKLRHLRLCTVSGEFLCAEVAGLFNQLVPNCILLNLYGSTEIAADICWSEVSPASAYKAGQIGQAIPGCAIHILNTDLKPMPPGSVGELCVSGMPVSAGYLTNKNTDSLSFVPNPFGEGYLYKTGDLANRQTDGSLFLHGRMDTRHKLNGKRVDLFEINSVITQHEQISFATSQITKNGQLISWYQSKTGHPINKTDLNQFMVECLPAWMIPSQLVHTEKLPRLATGKIDGDALLASAKQQRVTIDSSEHPVTDTEKTLAALWKEILPDCTPMRDSVFIETGGDSLSAMRFNANIQRIFSASVPPRMMLVANLKQLARSLDNNPNDQEHQQTVSTKEIPNSTPLLEPIIFAANERSLYGVIHHPAIDSKNSAVLMCSSIGHEYMKLHRLYHSIAVNLSKQGYYVMRFDYTGFGNSSGEPDSVTVKHWHNDIEHAANQLLLKSQKKTLTMIGSRLGLPLLLSAVDEKTNKIVALDPVYDGHAFVAHLDKLHQFALADADRYHLMQNHSNPNERFGYQYSQQLLDDIASLQVNLCKIEQDMNICVLQTGNQSDIDGSGRHAMRKYTGDNDPSSSVKFEEFPDLPIWLDYATGQSLIMEHALANRVAEMVNRTS